MLRDALLETLRRPGTWLLIAANTLPILGALTLGWNVATLVVLYWMETAVIGFWLLVRLAWTEPDQLGASSRFASGPGTPLSGPVLAVFVLLHASIFMLVHFNFLTFLVPGEWTRHLGSVQDFVLGFIVPSGIWVPLAGLFAVRGIIVMSEIRARAPAANVIGGFYGRIIIMQFTILFSGFLALAVGGVAMLVLLVVLKTLADIFVDVIGGLVANAIERKPAA